MRVQSLGWKDLLEEGMAPTPVFLHGESHGQRSLVGYGPYGCNESDMTEATQHACIQVAPHGFIIGFEESELTTRLENLTENLENLENHIDQ